MSELHSGNWPDDWYVFDDGKVLGPYPADQAFNLDPAASSGKPRLISRKGFSQWYALGDMKLLFTMTSQNIPQTIAPNLTVPKLVKPNKIFPKREEAIQRSQSRAKPLAAADDQGTNLLTAKPLAKASLPIKGSIKRHLLSEYFQVKSRLRLGTIRNPWASALSTGILSLGLACPYYFGELASEIAFHTRSESEHRLGPAFLVLIPIVQFWMIWRLAKDVQSLEKQNGYQSVSVALATFLGFFPPLALAYLQSEVNRHWLLHARQVWLRRRSNG